MNSQSVTVAKGRDNKDYSFFEALSFESKESSALISKEKLGLPPSPSTPTATKPIVPEKNTAVQKTNPTSNGPSNPTKTKPMSKMDTTSKAQSRCLELCHKTTALIDRISVHILEYLTSTKQLPYGFETLAHDFLDTCQILFSIEAGLGEYNRTAQKFPPEMITELDHKFRVTQADFQILDQMLSKFLGTSGRMKRGWGKLFGDTDIKKITTALGKTRESLRMSSLVFQWSLGSEKVEREMGIGYTGLAAALDRMDHKIGNGKAKGPNDKPTHSQPALPSLPSVGLLGMNDSNGSPQLQLPSVGLLEGIDSHNAFQQQQKQSVPWSNRSSSVRQEESLGRVSSNNARVPLNLDPHQPFNLDFRQNGTTTALTLPAAPALPPGIDTYDRASTVDDARSLAGITETDSVLEDLLSMELGNSQVVRFRVDPTTMPRCYPRNTPDSDSANMKAALVSAVRSKNHKLLEQLLTRGVPANTGPSMHALRDAILAHDDESIRLLLLFGADPNDPDRDGTTPLFAAVEKSYLAGATTLLKYGADPNLVAGPDLESPLAVAVMANMVGFSHLLLTYNGDANHITASGNTLLISAIKKKTPKKFIDLLLDYGAEPNAKSRDGRTALFEAIQFGRADIVASLLERGADANLPGPKHMLWPATSHPSCLQILLSHGADHKKCPGIMELAASFNNIESVRILLKAGVNPNTKKDGVYTPLCTAIRDDRADLLRLLLNNEADPNTMASEYPSFKCVTHNRVHFLPALVAAGADLHTPKGILETAVSSKNIEALNWLLDQGVNPNDKSPKGMTPLTTAIRESQIEMVDLLLMRGADPHMRGEDWPICMAVRNPPILKRILTVVSEPQAFKGVMEMAVSANQLESVKLLIAAGVSVEDKNGGVFSPLTTAIREDRRAIVSYLLNDGGADVNAPGEHLPIVKALRRYHGEDTEIMELLLEHGADPNKIYRGWNAVMQGIENGDIDALRLLSQKAGVDLEVKDESGRTVVEMAASRGWGEAVDILKRGNVRSQR